MESFGQKLLLIFFTALGVVLGASLIGSLAAVLSAQPPLKTMTKLAYEIKIWAIVAAIGGTFTTIEVLEMGIFEGEIINVIKQFLFIFSAFLGAQVGYSIIWSLSGGQ
ncbi:YtrH family sporulation protein [Calderihabitans maritimus]|uniref:Uncharacterized NAD(FAD)-dependent dehydrogenases n=1 Tax=Calderihabitans maritimus TaxID=1246530 RepID=A0A1Z5HPN2_9FIRM|nr:YtrH family sporulation protein [Calderihabitans maritimus]GAW91281.1 uncharacterized NAD(FAD)-dependent dehydrogenases [Calderihabitans maritimus]